MTQRVVFHYYLYQCNNIFDRENAESFFLLLPLGKNKSATIPRKRENIAVCFVVDSELLSFLKQLQSGKLSISVFSFWPARRETGKVSLLLWCGSCSFGTPLYAHLFSLNHSCKQVESTFFSYSFWIEFKAPGNSGLLC